MQKILTMQTNSSSLRSSCDGWSAEDGDVIRTDREIGLSPDYHGFHCFKTPMHAIADGWKLLSPPVMESDAELDYYGAVTKYAVYQWWFVKD